MKRLLEALEIDGHVYLLEFDIGGDHVNWINVFYQDADGTSQCHPCRNTYHARNWAKKHAEARRAK